MQNKKFLMPKAEKFRKEILKWDGSSDILKKMTNFNKISNFRLKSMMIVIICLFMIIAFQLVRVQIYMQDEYIAKLEKYTIAYQKLSPPRGQIYDRSKNLVVSNEPLLNIIYTPPYGISDDEEWELSRLLVKQFKLLKDEYTIRDLKDAYIKLYPTETEALITAEEMQKYYARILNDNDIYELKLKRISEEEIEKIDEETIVSGIIKILLDSATKTTPAIILEDVVYEDAVYIAEHKDVFAGFDNSYDWQRNYIYGDTLKSVLGRVSTSKQGLPSESKSYLTALGYSLNERVGISGIEQQYEELLNGEYMYVNYTYDSFTNLPVQEVVTQGKKGYDLQLSLNMDLQNKVEKLVSEALLAATNNKYRQLLKEMYVVMLDVETGEVLSMVGKEKNEENNIIDKSYGTYMDLGAVIPGSIVKGATVYMGLSENLITKNTYLLDEPLYIQGTPVKKSWQNMGMINEIDALRNSSNVYMFKIAMRLANTTYTRNGPLYIKDFNTAFNTIRKYFRSFGLGTLTGIDLPGETIGYIGKPFENGHLLDFAIGQYDSYTLMQIAQYVATIANDGVKVTPHILQNAYETGSEEVVYTYPVELQNILTYPENIKHVQAGFRECVTNGLCTLYLNNLPFKVAAKSGTAENTVINSDGSRTIAPNQSFIAYAPYDKPEVAIACAAPHAYNDVSQPNVCQKVIADALKAYYDTKK